MEASCVILTHIALMCPAVTVALARPVIQATVKLDAPVSNHLN
jgi:hypothetical protein